ncbi:LysR substrate-binding domain-containing protein [Rhodopila sp.]|uniref:LysR family transcriptional regulator n=1 Tax=Rhodopila sp. TaxID=2480087 RepID=UPI003D0C1DD7
MDRLIAMESYVRTVERGSFAAAAADQGLSPSMIGNHVRYLEARLGALLLNRTTRQQSVTEFGRAYYEQCRRILLDIEIAEGAADLMQSKPRGLLRVTTSMTLGTTVMPGMIAAYLRRHSEVQVDLVLQDQRLDLLADELDVAVRAGTLPDSGLIARALPPLRLVACASPSYLRSHGHPRTPAELQTHNCLDFTYAGEPRVWRFAGPEGDVAIQVGGSLRVNNGQALRAAALEHLGIILQPEILVADDIASGRLIHLLADQATPSLPLHLLTLPDRHPSPKLRNFIDLVLEMFRSVGSTKEI